MGYKFVDAFVAVVAADCGGRCGSDFLVLVVETSVNQRRPAAGRLMLAKRLHSQQSGRGSCRMGGLDKEFIETRCEYVYARCHRRSYMTQCVILVREGLLCEFGQLSLCADGKQGSNKCVGRLI